VHHLAIANNVSLEAIATLFARLAPNAIVEFVPKDDPMVQKAARLAPRRLRGLLAGRLRARVRDAIPDRRARPDRWLDPRALPLGAQVSFRARARMRPVLYPAAILVAFVLNLLVATDVSPYAAGRSLIVAVLIGLGAAWLSGLAAANP
jgi:hypothetical protein